MAAIRLRAKIVLRPEGLLLCAHHLSRGGDFILEESCRRCGQYRYRARRDPFNSWSSTSRNRLPDRCESRCKRAASVTATNMPRKVHGRGSSTRASLDMRSRESLTPWARALPDGKWGNESESAGT